MTNLEKKRDNFRGLNLTNRTLLSVTKYFNRFDIKKYEEAVKEDKKDKQKFLYDSDYEYIRKITEENKVALRTLDVQMR